MEHKPNTFLEANTTYASLDAALVEAAGSRWHSGVICVHCGADSPMFLKTRRIWKCSKCRKQFSFKAGTLLEDSPIGLDKWLPAIWMIANDRNGTSSWELHRKIGVTQKTAWFMLHRIRLAMQDKTTGGKIGGPGKEVEADETMIGGKARNMHPAKRNTMRNRDNFGKAIVSAVLERHGKVHATVVPNRRKKAIQEHVREHVEAGSTVYSDELKSYNGLTEYTHEVINHAETYVNGQIHTNGMENFWSYASVPVMLC